MCGAPVNMLPARSSPCSAVKPASASSPPVSWLGLGSESRDRVRVWIRVRVRVRVGVRFSASSFLSGARIASSKPSACSGEGEGEG